MPRKARRELKPNPNAEVYYDIRNNYPRRDLQLLRPLLEPLSSEHAKACVRRLLKHENLARAFDEVIESPGLRAGLKIGSLHKLIDMRCDEEILTYLRHIRDIWTEILGGRPLSLSQLDPETVQAIESKCPKYSKSDSELLQAQICSGAIFGFLSSEGRNAAWDRLLTIDVLIPSLKTLFKDRSFLQSCAESLCQVISLDKRDKAYLTVDKVLRRNFPIDESTTSMSVLEIAENKFYPTLLPQTQRFNVARFVLWLKVMRHYDRLARSPKKEKSDLVSKPRPEGPDERILFEVAEAAHELGFRSDRIQELRTRSPDELIARKALLKARKPAQYTYADGSLDTFVGEIATMCTKAIPQIINLPAPALVSNELDEPSNRYGFPDMESFDRDRAQLFIQNLLHQPDGAGLRITSFLVRKSVITAFLGPLPESLTLPIPRNDKLDNLTSAYSNASFNFVHNEVNIDDKIREQDAREAREQDNQKARETKRAGREDLFHPAQEQSYTRKRKLNEGQIVILFKEFKGGRWQTVHKEDVTLTGSTVIETTAIGFRRKEMSVFSTNLCALSPEECFTSAVSNGLNTLLLLPDNKTEITDALRESVRQLVQEGTEEERRRGKRHPNND